MKETAIIMTTIRKPVILEGLCENILRFGHEKDTRIYVVGDHKTPDIAQYVRDQPVEALYFTAQEQQQIESLDQRLSKAMQTVPYNNDARRNAGMLFALSDGYNKMINLDDDNFPINDGEWIQKRPALVDFVGASNIVGTQVTARLWRSANNWLNSGRFLRNDMNTVVYQRGFPINQRWKDTADLSTNEETVTVALNGGVWLETPDADAINHIITPVKNIDYFGPDHILLAKDVYTPINTQNSAYSSKAAPAFMFIGGAMMHDTFMNRLGDIWCGYLAERIAYHMGELSCIGAPLVRHIRNSHNYKQDAFQEFWGMHYMDQFTDFIQSQELTERTYAGAYHELGEKFIKNPVCGDSDMNKFFAQMGRNMMIWAETCENIN